MSSEWAKQPAGAEQPAGVRVRGTGQPVEFAIVDVGHRAVAHQFEVALQQVLARSGGASICTSQSCRPPEPTPPRVAGRRRPSARAPARALPANQQSHEKSRPQRTAFLPRSSVIMRLF
jgi:hypothetical protein